ncbi:hypothetical protein [Amycolatopsis nigrescens]|uniref:hypothetical protein n=1 Tax=Amycolatopsis nigrescens TaxID=381445 RepID=UPI00036CCC57|nr:hypothetical protein [Amycolatopsis nigrescens]
MGEHAEKTEKGRPDDATQALPPVGSSTAGDTEGAAAKRGTTVDWRRTKDTTVGFIAGLVRWIGLIFAAVLVLHIIFVIAEANAENGIVTFIRGWAEPLTLGFRDLFVIPEDAKLQVLVNFGIAALFWLIVSAVLAKIIRRVGGTAS